MCAQACSLVGQGRAVEGGATGGRVGVRRRKGGREGGRKRNGEREQRLKERERRKRGGEKKRERDTYLFWSGLVWEERKRKRNGGK